MGALLLALGGLSLVVGAGSNAHGSVPDAVPLLGLATGTLAAIAFALLSALARMLAGRIHPLQAVSFGFVIGAVLLAPIVVLSGPALKQPSAQQQSGISYWSRLSRRCPHRARVHLLISMACSAARRRPRELRRR
jgi:drug/metabolite transporter (DMT)-like permease